MTTQLPEALNALAARGLTGSRKTSTTSHTIKIQGIAVTSPHDEVTWTFTLPSDSGQQTTFTEERWQHTLVKLFKEEPQLGDELFDKSVYITTNNAPSCLELLRSSEQLSDAIMAAVDEGATIQIQNSSVVWTKRVALGLDPEPEPRHLNLLLGALMRA